MESRSTLFILLCGVFLLFPFKVFGRADSIPVFPPKVRAYTPDEYNSHSQVFCVEEGTGGVMLFGSNGGFLEFDGEEWKQVGIPTSAPILAMELGESGRLWVGGSGDLGFVEPANSLPNGWKFTSLTEKLDSSFLPGLQVFDIETLNGRVYFLSPNALFEYEPERDSLIPYSLKDQHVGFIEAVSGELWGHMIQKGICSFEREKGTWDLRDKGYFMKEQVERVLPTGDEEEGIYIITRYSGIYRMRPNKKDRFYSVEPFSRSFHAKEEKIRIYGATLLEPGKNPYGGRIALNTVRAGVEIIDTTGKSVMLVNRKEGLPSGIIWDSYQDRKGNIWVGTNNGAAFINSGVPYSIAREGRDYKGSVNDIAKYEGDLYVGTSNGVLRVVRGMHYSKLVPVKKARGQVLDLLPTPHGLITSPSTIIRTGRDLSDFQEIHDRPHDVLREVDELENVFISGHKNNFFIFRFADGKWEKYYHFSSMDGQINDLAAFRKADSLFVWATYRTPGATRLTIAVDSQGVPDTTTLEKRYFEKGYPDGSSRCFPFDGRVVFGTDQGAYELKGDSLVPDPSFGKVFSDGSRMLFRLYKDPDGDVWISDDKGGEVKHLIPDGKGYRIDSAVFAGMEIGSVRYIHPLEGPITFIGGDKGWAVFNEKLHSGLVKEGPVVIRKVRIPNVGQNDSDSLLYQGPHVPERENIPRIPFHYSRLEFKYAAPYFHGQDKVKYRYRLKGFDTAWSRWTKRNSAVFTNMAGGKYTFQVQARDVHGLISPVKEYAFRIIPPWYNTWTAYAGYGVLGLLFVWLMAYLNSWRLREQKRKLEEEVEERTGELRAQKEEIERAHSQLQEKTNEITDSINYAQRIQKALLQNEEHISDGLPEHFIFLKPKDVVSGDFYWARYLESMDPYWYVTVADCTGHGVPGAFMSMLGVTFLNEITEVDEPLSPNIILDKLRDRVIRELGQKGDEGETQDGMDISLVRIDLRNFKIQWAGANNPIWVVRPAGRPSFEGHQPFTNEDCGYELLEWKGDKQPVGYSRVQSSFTPHELQLQEGDTLYLFSDGFADQFGGTKGKKFKYKRMKEVLLRIQHLSMEEQKRELSMVFEDWKGEVQQIDDVCVVGIRLG